MTEETWQKAPKRRQAEVILIQSYIFRTIKTRKDCSVKFLLQELPQKITVSAEISYHKEDARGDEHGLCGLQIPLVIAG